MKKIFTFSILLLTCTSLWAFPYKSRLTFSSFSGSISKIIVDNRTYTLKDNNDGVIIEDLLPGNHRVRIYKIKNGYNGNKFGTGQMQLQYNENVFIKQGYHTDIVINRFGRVLLDEEKLRNGNYEEEDFPGYNWGNEENGRMVISVSDFQQLKTSVGSGNFESTKLTVAKQAISQHFFTALQIKEILELFSFEDSKLQLAKYAYEYCIDTQRYFVVADAFTFSSSKEDLLVFLGKKQK